MAKNNSTVEVGDVVRICLDNLKGKGEHYLPEWVIPKMKKFDGVEAEVIRVVKLAPNTSVYELDGVTNWKDMPYTWTREALIKLNTTYMWTYKESVDDEYPKYVEYSITKLAEKVGVSVHAIRTSISRTERGLTGASRYGRIKLEDD